MDNIRILDDEYFAEVDEDDERRNNPFEIRMRKIHHLLHSIDPDIIHSNEDFSPMGFVLRMERIQVEIVDKLKEVEEKRKQRAIERCKRIKEELISVCWHPDRVEKLLDMGILEEMW